MVAWDVTQREGSAIAADAVSIACLREETSEGRKQSLILHDDNSSSVRWATLEVRLEELGVHRSVSGPRVSTDNPNSGSLLGTVKYRPNSPRWLLSNKEEGCY